MTTRLQRGIDPGRLIGGLTTAGIGGAAIVATATGMRFAYRRLAIPEWAAYAFGAVLLVVAAFTIKKAMTALKCACGKTLDEGSVVLPGDGGREAPIVQAVQNGRIGSLAPFVGQSEDFSLKLALDFCSACRQTANVNLLKDDSRKLVADVVLTGAPAAEAIAFMEAHGKVEDD